MTDLERSKWHQYHQVNIWYDEVGEFNPGYFETWHWYVEECHTLHGFCTKSKLVRHYFPTIASAKRYIDAFGTDFA